MWQKMDRRLVFGFMPNWPGGQDQTALTLLQEAHTQCVRVSIAWDLIEPNPPQGGQHTYDWGAADTTVDRYYSRGIKMIALQPSTAWWAAKAEAQGTADSITANTLTDNDVDFSFIPSGPPEFQYDIRITGGTGAGQSQRVKKSLSSHEIEVEHEWATRPDSTSTYTITGHAAFVLPEEAHLADFNAFHTAVASRYSGKLRYYEFWNEPNCCGPGVNSTRFFTVNDYTKWLGRVRSALRAGDSNVLVAVGGTDVRNDASSGSTPPCSQAQKTDYLQGVYNYISGVGGDPDNYFDAVCIHPYEGNPKCSPSTPVLNMAAIDGHRNLMVSNSDSEKSIWVTEYGWKLDGVTEQDQSDWIVRALDALTAADRYYVTAATFHFFADFPGGPGPWGVVRQDMTKRPAYNAFKDYAGPRTPRQYSLAPFVTQV